MNGCKSVPSQDGQRSPVDRLPSGSINIVHCEHSFSFSTGTRSALLAARVHVERREHGGECGGRQEHPADEQLLRFEDDHRDRSFGSLLVAGVALEHRGDLGPELVPLLVGSDAAIMGQVEPAIVTLTSGLACRLRYHAGCRSSPPYEATSTTQSPSAIDAASIVERSLPDLRPVVTSSTTGIPKALLKIRPFETLKSARWMRVATLYNASLDLMRIGPVPRSTVIGFLLSLVSLERCPGTRLLRESHAGAELQRVDV